MLILLTTEELASKLRISRKKLQQLADDGAIPFYRLGPRSLHFDETEVLAAMKRKATIEPERAA